MRRKNLFLELSIIFLLTTGLWLVPERISFFSIALHRRIRGSNSFSIKVGNNTLAIDFSNLDRDKSKIISDLREIFKDYSSLFDSQKSESQKIAEFFEVLGSFSSRDKFFLAIATFPERFFDLLKNPVIKNVLIANPSHAPPSDKPDIQEALLQELSKSIPFDKTIFIWVYYLFPQNYFSDDLMDELIYFSFFAKDTLVRIDKDGYGSALGALLFNLFELRDQVPTLNKALKGLASIPGIEKYFKELLNGSGTSRGYINELIRCWEILEKSFFKDKQISSLLDLNSSFFYSSGKENPHELDALFQTSSGDYLAISFKTFFIPDSIPSELYYKDISIRLLRDYLKWKISAQQNGGKIKIQFRGGDLELDLDSFYFDLSFSKIPEAEVFWKNILGAIEGLLQNPVEELASLLSLYAGSIPSQEEIVAWLKNHTNFSLRSPDVDKYQVFKPAKDLYKLNSDQSTIIFFISSSFSYSFQRALLLVAAYLKEVPSAKGTLIKVKDVILQFGYPPKLNDIFSQIENNDPSFYQKPLSEQSKAFLDEWERRHPGSS